MAITFWCNEVTLQQRARSKKIPSFASVRKMEALGEFGHYLQDVQNLTMFVTPLPVMP
jgi:hypothetical protein